MDMRVAQAHGARRSSAAATATRIEAADDALTSSPDEVATEAPSLADSKRLKHREYVKKSYNKKVVRPTSAAAHLLMKSCYSSLTVHVCVCVCSLSL